MLKHILFAICVIAIGLMTLQLLAAPLPVQANESQKPQPTPAPSEEPIVIDDSYFIVIPLAEQGKEITLDLRQETNINANLDGYTEKYKGVYIRQDASATIIRINTNEESLRFFVNPAQSPQTVCQFVSQYGLQLAINGGGFDIGGSGQAIPFAMSEGIVYSRENHSDITIFIKNDKIIFGDGNNEKHIKEAQYAVSGFNRVVQKGKILDKFKPSSPDYKQAFGGYRPRTSIGISGNWLNIVLFQNSTITDIGRFHIDNFEGTTDVFNMDGGGSTNGCTDQGPIFPESYRPVANIFGVFASPP